MSVIIFTDGVAKTRRAGAYRIASSLKYHGVETEIIDFLSKWNIDQLLLTLDKIKNIEWVGFSLTYLNYESHTKNKQRITDLEFEHELLLIEYFRRRNIPIVLGGSNADTIKNFVSNFWILIGYADNAVIKLHDHLTRNIDIKFKIINNNNVIFCDDDYADIDLSKFTTSFQETDHITANELIPIEISRGCIFKCAFCEFAYLGKKPGTYIRSKKCIQSEIENLNDLYGVTNFLFVDDTFNDSIEKMRMIKDIRNDSKIPFTFWSYGRLDLLASNSDMFNLIEEIGWKAITFGVETMNRSSGSKIGKGADPEKLKKCLLEIRKKYPNIHLQINLIIGLPNSTKKDILETVDWFLDNNTADYLRVIDLDIKDPSNIRFSSKISQNPKKYGYQIISTDNIRFQWQNENWNNETAKLLSNQINAYIDSKKPNNKPYHRLHYESQINHIKNYIEEKIKSLEILTTSPI